MFKLVAKYYYFNSSIGKLALYFVEQTIVGFSFENDLYISKYMKKHYEQIEEVNENDYDFHHEIIEYLNGERKTFNLNIDLKGTDFQRKVWNELLNIPYGEVYTYKQLAERVGNEKASRAVGSALNKNPIAVIVPCHRVIGSNNKLVGFAGGLDLKEKLINLERNNKM